MSDPCPDCGRDRVLVGYRHNCNVVLKYEAPSDPVGYTPGKQFIADLKARIAELEAENAKLKDELDLWHNSKPVCPVCKKRKAAKAKAQKKRRSENKA